MPTKKQDDAEKAEAPQGTLPSDPDADNPGEQADTEAEALKLAQERIDAGQVGTIQADQESSE